MPLYLSLLDGESPDTARSILVTRDPVILTALAEALKERVRQGASAMDAKRALTLVQVEADSICDE